MDTLKGSWDKFNTSWDEALREAEDDVEAALCGPWGRDYDWEVWRLAVEPDERGPA